MEWKALGSHADFCKVFFSDVRVSVLSEDRSVNGEKWGIREKGQNKAYFHVIITFHGMLNTIIISSNNILLSLKEFTFFRKSIPKLFFLKIALFRVVSLAIF